LNDLGEFLNTHKKIAEIFPEEWFKSELQKSEGEMHLLAKQFTFDDHPYDNSISNHIFDHLEENLEILRGEIHRKGKIFRKLKDPIEYTSTIGQIELCSFFKRLGFDVELEPRIPGSKKISDIKISNGKNSAYIEVRTLYDREGDIIDQLPSTTISTINYHPIKTLKDKIKEKTQQLSEQYPGIIAFNLDDPISRTLHIKIAFYEIARDYPIISGLLLYHHYFNSEGCQKSIKLLKNPYANKPLHDSIENDFDKGGIEIYGLTEEEIKIVESRGGK
jgi:hypothetical protein